MLDRLNTLSLPKVSSSLSIGPRTANGAITKRSGADDDSRCTHYDSLLRAPLVLAIVSSRI